MTLINYTSDWKQAKNSMGHEVSVGGGEAGAGDSNISYQVSLHIRFVHAFVNPLLFLVLHKDLRTRALQMLCCVVNAGYPADGPGLPRHTPVNTYFRLLFIISDNELEVESNVGGEDSQRLHKESHK